MSFCILLITINMRFLFLLGIYCALLTSHHGLFAMAANCIEYTVKAGDICYNIAQDHGISLDDFYSWNPAINCDNLQIGQVVCVSNPSTVPPPSGSCQEYTIQAGDTCWAISQAFGLSLTDFQSWNAGINCDNLQIGQIVCVSSPGSTPPAPPPPPSQYNDNIFMEYIGALWNGVKLSDVPINSNVDFYFILAFAIDYTTSGGITPTNGVFNVYWQYPILTPDAVQAIKAQHTNVKVMLSLGGDTVSGQSVLFSPTSTTTWVSNAVSSLTSLIQNYHLDGIDIDYEHFAASASPATFASCIGQLIRQLKQNEVISVATIAPFDGVESHYIELWNQENSVIDYVNFQFYSYSSSTSESQYVSLYNTAASKYGGGSKVLASFNTASNVGPPPATVISACEQLKSSGKLPGIFIWSADNSYVFSSNFTYEQQAQSLLAAASNEEQAPLSFVA